MSTSDELRRSIDREWLDQASRDDPIAHAYARWNLLRFPDRVQFVSAIRDGRTQGYLMFWPLTPAVPLVHWVGPPDGTASLIDALPPRPLIVNGPAETEPWVRDHRGPLAVHPIRIMEHPHPPADAPSDPSVRRLSGPDRSALTEFGRRHSEPMAAGYDLLDPDEEPVWAGFEGDRIVAVARPTVRLADLWLIGRVFVAPASRNRGWGGRVVAAVLAAAGAAGVRCGLYVRDDAAPARRVYDRLGFRTVAERRWMDAGADWPV